MVQYFHRIQPSFRQHISVWFLSLVWVSGLAAGAVVYFVVGPVFFHWMREILYGSVSIVGLFCVTCFPFLFSAFAVYIGLRWLIYPICFWKTMLVSMVSLALWVQFGSTGWLAWLLIMFSDVISLPFLYRYCLRNVSGNRSFSCPEFFATISILIFIGSVDYCCISPFLAMLSF